MIRILKGKAGHIGECLNCNERDNERLIYSIAIVCSETKVVQAGFRLCADCISELYQGLENL